jgi:hypothetical protein
MPMTDKVALANNYAMLHEQPRNCWTFELAVHPWIER